MDANSKKVEHEDIDAAIASVEYVLLPDGVTTIADVTLDNGFTVRGESSPAVPGEFDRAQGEVYAMLNARTQIRRHLAFRLADLRMAAGRLPATKPKVTRYRCAETGEYVSKAYADENPATTVGENR